MDAARRDLWEGGPVSGRSLALWAGGLVLALALNAALLGLMPLLLPRSGQPGGPGKDHPAISVIRQKKQETPARKRETVQKEPEKKQPRKTPLAKRPAPKKPKAQKPHLPFAVNSRLPAASGDLALPDLSRFSIGPPPADPGLSRLEYVLGELDSPLTPVAAMPPVYPFRARKMGIEGWVTVRFSVDETGAVKNPEVVDAKPKGIFEEAVLRCVTAWRFSPPTKEGKPVRTVWERTIEFALQ